MWTWTILYKVELRYAFTRVRPVGPIHAAGVQPFGDEPYQTLISDAVFQKLDEPAPVHIVEKCAHVRIKNPVDFTPFNSVRKRIKRVVRPASRPKPVTNPRNSDS